MKGFTLSDISQDDMCEIVQSWIKEKFESGYDSEARPPRAKFVYLDPETDTFSIDLRYEDPPAPEAKDQPE